MKVDVEIEPGCRKPQQLQPGAPSASSCVCGRVRVRGRGRVCGRVRRCMCGRVRGRVCRRVRRRVQE